MLFDRNYKLWYCAYYVLIHENKLVIIFIKKKQTNKQIQQQPNPNKNDRATNSTKQRAKQQIQQNPMLKPTQFTGHPS